MKDWKKTTASPSMPIREVIKKIDAGSAKIALIVSDQGELLGTVTDGDVRRAILHGVSLEEPAERIMKKEPTTAGEKDSQESILALMKSKHICQIPIVNKTRRLVGLEVLDELLESSGRDNWVILMAGGLGSRLKPLTDVVPKPLIPVGNKPILEIILDNFIDNGFKNFYIAMNGKDRRIKHHFDDGSRWGVHIGYLFEEKRLGTAGALALLPERPDKTFFVMNSDLLTKVNFIHLLNFHRENKAAATMCVREYDLQVPYGVVKINRHSIKSVDEKPVQRLFVNAGIYVLEPETINYIPKNKMFDMTQLFEKIIQEKHRTAAFPIREYWIDIGHLNDLERAKDEYPTVFP